jgi:Heterokaryon incompatibility protein (HET)
MFTLSAITKLVSKHKEDGNYRYKALPSHDSIRLLELFPGKDDAPLRGEIITTTIQNAPSYNALSYVWGDASFAKTLICYGDGLISNLQITQNLAAALLAIRSPSEIRVIWVDAICIDQNDILERNDQVKMMAAIYRTAERVIVYLGNQSFGSVNEAFEIATKLVNDEKYRASFLKAPDVQTLDILRELTCLEWFHRTWTSQEIGLANRATLLCGIHKVDWDLLYRAYRIIETQVSSTMNHQLAFHPERITFLYQSFSLNQAHSFLDLLAQTRSRNASDSKDKVFALLSHPKAYTTGRLIITADYTKSTLQVYRETAFAVMNEMRNLDALSHAPGLVSIRSLSRTVSDLTPTRGSEWPSWVPRWDRESSTFPIIKGDQSCRACSGLEIPFGIDMEKGSSNLVVKGIELEKIDWIKEMKFHSDLASEVGDKHHCQINPGLFDYWFSTNSSEIDGENYGFNGQASKIEHAAVWLKLPTWYPEADEADETQNRVDAGRYGQEALTALALTLTGGANRTTSFCTWWQAMDLGDRDQLFMIKKHLRLSKGRLTASYSREKTKSFLTSAAMANKGRVLFLTETGFLGLGPSGMRRGDSLCILNGGRTPFLLRKLSSETQSIYGKLVGETKPAHWKLLGDCYVHGLMHGEIADLMKQRKPTPSKFIIR